MILSICLNCSLDTRYTLPGFRTGAIHSADPPSITAGGKGLNLARVAAQLGTDVTALGLVGEGDLDFFARAMEGQGVQPRFTPVPAPTRRCLNIMDPETKTSTEVLERGFSLDTKYFQAVLSLVQDLAPQASVICASGSVPPGLPADAYAQVGDLARSANRPFILDARGEHLREGLKARPFAVKPNLPELEAWTGMPLKTQAEIAAALSRLNQAGVVLAIVSLGAQGAMATCQGKFWHIRPPRVEAVNPVGSGDAFTAALAAGMEGNLPMRDLLAKAVACGTANAMHPETGHIEMSTIRHLLPRVEITEWEE